MIYRITKEEQWGENEFSDGYISFYKLETKPHLKDLNLKWYHSIMIATLVELISIYLINKYEIFLIFVLFFNIVFYWMFFIYYKPVLSFTKMHKTIGKYKTFYEADKERFNLMKFHSENYNDDYRSTLMKEYET